MYFNDKLRVLRTAQNLTQEQAAERLGVSAQSVSKWERGILSPDIRLLPKLAVLYGTSIDALFDMEFYWDEQHMQTFRSRIRTLLSCGDHEGVYQAYIAEIECTPDNFIYYPEVMLGALRAKLFDDAHIARLIRLCDYADGRCDDDNIRNEMHRLMLQICSKSLNTKYKEQAKQYYMQLSILRHSREIYARYVMEGKAYREQLQKNIMYTVDVAECAIRQMITSDMPPKEKLYFYQRAAALYEAVLNGAFGGFYDIPLMCDYAEMARLSVSVGDPEAADVCIRRLLSMAERIADPAKRETESVFVPAAYPKGCIPPETNAIRLLSNLLKDNAFPAYTEALQTVIHTLKQRETERSEP